MNPFKKQNETYTGDRSLKDLQVAKKSFWSTMSHFRKLRICVTCQKTWCLFESKTTIKGFILVYFQCDLWIFHCKNYLGTKFYEQVISKTSIINKISSLLRALWKVFLRWKGPKLGDKLEQQLGDKIFVRGYFHWYLYFKLILENIRDGVV